eukprot:g71027.t1
MHEEKRAQRKLKQQQKQQALQTQKARPKPLAKFSSEFKAPPHFTLSTGKGKGKFAKAVLQGKDDKEGPLALLKALFNKNCRVQVGIRKQKGMRGSCTGYLLAFDKHFNM